MKLNLMNPKRIILLALAVVANTAWAQTPAWQQQLERLDKEADQLYEQQDWKRLVANQKQYRKGGQLFALNLVLHGDTSLSLHATI